MKRPNMAYNSLRREEKARVSHRAPSKYQYGSSHQRDRREAWRAAAMCQLSAYRKLKRQLENRMVMCVVARIAMSKPRIHRRASAK